MNKQRFDVIIVGSGFSGIVAANSLADQGLSILLVDENIHIGGQLLRKIPERLGLHSKYRPEPVKKIGFALAKLVSNISIYPILSVQQKEMFINLKTSKQVKRFRRQYL